MKLPIYSLLVLCAGLASSACDKRPIASAEPIPVESAPAATPAPASPVAVDAEKFLQSFGAAGPEELSRVGKAAQAIRAQNFTSALETLDHLLAQGHLTPEQKQLVTDVVAQLRKLKPAKP